MEKARTYKYFDLIMAAFVAVLLCSDIIGVQKVSYIKLPFVGEYIYGAGVLFFPISYFFGDILTEVYGYKRSRRVIWADLPHSHSPH
jgi:queuosine precursor transporter